MITEKRTIFITGAAGYVGEMLCDQFAKREDVAEIIALDKEPQSDFSKSIPKLHYIQANLADGGWQEQVAAFAPDTVVHTAWQIRAFYHHKAEQWRWNVGGSQAVFDFSFVNSFVKKLIYFSTASSYSARADNGLDHYFTEAEGFRPDDYIYAREKMVVEQNLQALYEKTKTAEGHAPQVTILRPAAITGPRGRYMRIRFGLQSALQGSLQGGFINRLVTTLTAYMPATKGWARQFIHEDDVTDIVAAAIFSATAWRYEAFNITPLGAPVLAPAMAKMVGKKVLPIYPWMAGLAFWFFWHATRGRIPTCAGSWRFYSYPILMSGEKLAAFYQCRYSSQAAMQYSNGRYQEFVPEAKRNSI